MDEDFGSKQTKLPQSNSVEISFEEDQEVELSPVETIVWDCCEVNGFLVTAESWWIAKLVASIANDIGVPREEPS